MTKVRTPLTRVIGAGCTDGEGIDAEVVQNRPSKSIDRRYPSAPSTASYRKDVPTPTAEDVGPGQEPHEVVTPVMSVTTRASTPDETLHTFEQEPHVCAEARNLAARVCLLTNLRRSARVGRTPEVRSIAPRQSTIPDAADFHNSHQLHRRSYPG